MTYITKIMYDLYEITDSWTAIKNEHEHQLHLSASYHNAMMCLVKDTALSGISFVDMARGNWQCEEGITYSRILPWCDVLESVLTLSGRSENFHPRLHFSPSDVVIPISFDEELNLPLMLLKAGNAKLIIDAIPKNANSLLFPNIFWRAAHLQFDKRQKLSSQRIFTWRNHDIKDGELAASAK